MKTSKLAKVLSLAILIVAVLLFLIYWVIGPDRTLRPSSGSAMNSETNRIETSMEHQDRVHSPEEEEYISAIEEVFNKPFVLYGIVQDTMGSPIPNAEVRYQLMDNADPNYSATWNALYSGTDGRFVISAAGLGIYIEVSKKGFKPIKSPELGFKSKGQFRSDEGLASLQYPIGTPDSPSIFTLKENVRDIVFKNSGPRSIIVSKNEIPVRIDMETARTVQNGLGDLVVSMLTDNYGIPANSDQKYNWRCRISIPSGGIIVQEDVLREYAPEDGYSDFIEIVQNKNDENWKPNVSESFFIKMQDGMYAHVKLRINTRGDHFIVFESKVNPNHGDRYLN